MNGYADFKSHLLRREEKGMIGIPFKRWLLSGCVGGLVLILARIVVGDLSVVVALISVIGALLLTTPVGGIPRWHAYGLDWRWRLAQRRAVNPYSLLGNLAEIMQIPADDLSIDSNSVFQRPPIEDGLGTAISDWTFFTELNDLNAGLVILQDLHPNSAPSKKEGA